MNLREQMLKILSLEDTKTSKYLITKYLISQIDLGKYPKIMEVSKKCYVSNSTIFRYSQSLGCDGYKELINKIKFEDEMNYHWSQSKNISIANSETDILESFKLELSKYVAKLDVDGFIKPFCKRVLNAKKIYIFSSYELNWISNILFDGLSLLNLNVIYSSDLKVSTYFINNIAKDEICLFICGGHDNDYLKIIWNLLDKNERYLISSTSQSSKFTNPTKKLILGFNDQMGAVHNKELELTIIFRMIFIYVAQKKNEKQKINHRF